MAACFGDLFVNQSSRENRVFCTIRVFFRTGFKNVSFFLRISWLFIFLSVFPSFKITVFTHKLSIFFLTSSPIFKKKYGFCFFLNVFHISCLRFLELGVFDNICEYDAWISVFDALVRFLCGSCWLCVVTLCLWLHNVLFVGHTHSVTWLRPHDFRVFFNILVNWGSKRS